MTHLRAPIERLEEGEGELAADVAHYVVRVLRLRAGDTFVAFDPAAAKPVEADVTVVSERAGVVVARIGALRPAAVVAPRAVTLVQGLAKGDKCDDVVRDATELGATRVIVAASARSVVRLDGDRAAAKLARWTKIAREAARQAGRADPPSVELSTWSDAVAAARDARAFCLWERATAPLGPPLIAALADAAAPLAFAVGPEGGLDDAEVEVARASGFAVVSLGALVLRTETVCAAVLGAVRILSS